ncbi:MAG: SSU ribosomal protein S10p (S20e), partial [uncultured Phycisphaerae bacterium]
RRARQAHERPGLWSDPAPDPRRALHRPAEPAHRQEVPRAVRDADPQAHHRHPRLRPPDRRCPEPLGRPGRRVRQDQGL